MTREFHLRIHQDDDEEWYVEVPGRMVQLSGPIVDLRSMVQEQLRYALCTPEKDEGVTQEVIELAPGWFSTSFASFAGCANCGRILPDHTRYFNGYYTCSDQCQSAQRKEYDDEVRRRQTSG